MAKKQRQAGKSAVLDPAGTTVTAVPAPNPSLQAADDTLDRIYKAFAKWVGSLQVAVILLTAFVVVMAIGTIVESWYTGKLAQDLVYRTWWFQVLMAGLFLNILFAALKKWPWKRHQTGFLVTHLGLLTMITGGVLTLVGPSIYAAMPTEVKPAFAWLQGSDHLMVMVDNESPQYEEYGQRATNRIHDVDHNVIEVVRGKEKLTYNFDPGLLPWRSDERLNIRQDALLTFLDTLAHPWPRSWSHRMFDDGRIEVLNYYPHARRDPYRPAEKAADKGEEKSFPAVRFLLKSGVGFNLEGWVAGDEMNNRARTWQQGPARVEFLARNLTSAQVEQFLKPPANVGARGTLVLDLHGQLVTLDLAKALGDDAKPVPLGSSGWSVKVSNWWSDFRERRTDGPADRPTVEFTLTHADKPEIVYVSMASLAGLKVGKCNNQLLLQQMDDDLSVWFHPPDPGAAYGGERAMLHLVSDRGGKLFYRSYSSGQGFGMNAPAAPLNFERSGPIEPRAGQATAIWDGMNWSLRITDYFEKAEAGERFVPVNRRAGLDKSGLTAVIRCKVTLNGKTAEIDVPRSDAGFRDVTVGGETLKIGLHNKTDEVPFTIFLERAEQTVDPGTQQAASFTSYVRLTDESRGIIDEPRVITMNEPLEYRGYKLYQTNYLSLFPDPNGKPVSHSTLTVGRDPGLILKYAGTIMLGLGIFLMFYMRSYMLTGKRRSVADAAAEAKPLPTNS